MMINDDYVNYIVIIIMCIISPKYPNYPSGLVEQGSWVCLSRQLFPTQDQDISQEDPNSTWQWTIPQFIQVLFSLQSYIYKWFSIEIFHSQGISPLPCLITRGYVKQTNHMWSRFRSMVERVTLDTLRPCRCSPVLAAGFSVRRWYVGKMATWLRRLVSKTQNPKPYIQ